MNVLHLPRPIYESIRAHGEESYPRECCGALLGRSVQGSWYVVSAVRAENARADSAQNRYQIAPFELVKIERAARWQGLEIAGFYHSHPDHPAQWSRTDLEEAHWVGCVYVITEVSKSAAGTTNSFLLAGTTEEDKRFEPQTIQIEECVGS